MRFPVVNRPSDIGFRSQLLNIPAGLMISRASARSKGHTSLGHHLAFDSLRLLSRLYDQNLLPVDIPVSIYTTKPGHVSARAVSFRKTAGIAVVESLFLLGHRPVFLCLVLFSAFMTITIILSLLSART